jgi:Protein of unknown function (DUF760)
MTKFIQRQQASIMILPVVLASSFLLTDRLTIVFGFLQQPILPPQFPVCHFGVGKHLKRSSRIFAGVGSGDDDRFPPPSNNNNNNDENRNSWDDFLNINYKESDNLLRAREYVSENSLPLSYKESEDDNNVDNIENDDANIQHDILSKSDSVGGPSVALARQTNSVKDLAEDGSLTAEDISKNPYIAVVSKLTPSELISKFTSTAHPKVQDAVRTTILGMLGGLPRMAFETTTITTGRKLASLMFQLQMTGYMFKVCKYIRI